MFQTAEILSIVILYFFKKNCEKKNTLLFLKQYEKRRKKIQRTVDVMKIFLTSNWKKKNLKMFWSISEPISNWKSIEKWLSYRLVKFLRIICKKKMVVFKVCRKKRKQTVMFFINRGIPRDLASLVCSVLKTAMWVYYLPVLIFHHQAKLFIFLGFKKLSN